MAAMAVGCGGSVVVAAVEERDETGGGAAVVARCFNVHNDRLLVGPLVEWSFNGKGADLRQVEAVHHTGTGKALSLLPLPQNHNSCLLNTPPMLLSIVSKPSVEQPVYPAVLFRCGTPRLIFMLTRALLITSSPRLSSFFFLVKPQAGSYHPC